METWRALRPAARRLRLLLRHGLSPATPLSALASSLSLTHNASATPVPLSLSRPSAATLLLEAPLQPSTTYTLRVSGSISVQDGMGLPLLPSHSTFTTADIQPKLLLPGDTDSYGYLYGALRPLRFATAPPGARGGDALTPPPLWPGLLYGKGGACRSPRPNGPSCSPERAVTASLTPVPPGRYRELLAALTSRPKKDTWLQLAEEGVAIAWGGGGHTGGGEPRGDTAGGLAGWPPVEAGFVEVRQAPLGGALGVGGTDMVLVRVYHSDDGARRFLAHSRSFSIAQPLLFHH